jgi:hypothetical protein
MRPIEQIATDVFNGLGKTLPTEEQAEFIAEYGTRKAAKYGIEAPKKQKETE